MNEHRMGEVGEPRREIIVEPEPATQPLVEPSPAPAPAEPVTEPVPA